MWTRLPSSGVRVTGADRLDFVHGQMTGDLKRAAVPGVVPCAFLNVRGQIEQFARVYRRSDDVYVHLSEGEAPALLSRLQRYRIFDQVEFEDLTDVLGTVHIWAENATPDAPHVPGWMVDGPEVQALDVEGCAVLAGRVNRTGSAGVDLHYLRRDETKVLAALPGTEAPLDALEASRTQAGIPDVHRDAFQGTLPQEIGLDVTGPLPAISYRKGCYVGQEIMARLEARGNARHHLVRLEGVGGVAWAAGDAVISGGRAVGQAGRPAGRWSVARLRKEVEVGTSVQVGEHAAVVRELPVGPAAS